MDRDVADEYAIVYVRYSGSRDTHVPLVRPRFSSQSDHSDSQMAIGLSKPPLCKSSFRLLLQEVLSATSEGWHMYYRHGISILIRSQTWP